jgi:hypothetical protein
MSKIINESQSSSWQYFLDLVKEHPGTYFNFQPVSDEFPEFYGDQKYEVMLYSGKTCDAIVDDSNKEKLAWRKMDGRNIVEGQVVAWKEVNKVERETLMDPFAFLTVLRERAEKTTQHVKALVVEAEMDIRLFKMSGETLLFQEEFPDFIKGCRFHNVVPKPHYIISGLKITAQPWHNNSFDKDVHCCVDVRVKLFIFHDRENEQVTFDDDPRIFWNCNIEHFELSKGEYKGEKFGVITQQEIFGDDSSILIEDFGDFIILKDALRRGYEAIGLPFKEPTTDY